MEQSDAAKSTQPDAILEFINLLGPVRGDSLPRRPGE